MIRDQAETADTQENAGLPGGPSQQPPGDLSDAESIDGNSAGRLKVSLGVIPTLFTLGNLICGFTAIRYATMDPDTRTLARITIDPENLPSTEALVETLMGKSADLRYQYIQDNARFIEDLDV